jgi:hypothetical protein
VDATLRNAKGQPTNTRTSIGRLDIKTGLLVPNDAYWRYYPDTQPVCDPVPAVTVPEVDSVLSAGIGFLTHQLSHCLGVTAMLTDALGPRRAGQVATMAAYMIAHGNAMDEIGPFCDEQLLPTPPMTDHHTSEVFASISHADRMAFFRAWARAQPTGSYYAYDVTSFSTYASGIRDTEWGYNRDQEKLPQINLGCYVNQDTGLPVFYLTYPGSIVDVSHLPSMMAFNTDLGVKDAVFVMDQGFCSTGNIQAMHTQHLPFLIRAGVRHKATRQAVDHVRADITTPRYRLPQGVYARSSKGRFYGVTATLHIYHDPVLAERQNADLDRFISSWDDTLTQVTTLSDTDTKRYCAYFTIDHHPDGTFTYEKNWDKIDTAARNHGYFTLLTTTSLDAEHTLDVYRRKDTIEKSFDEIKNHVGMHRLRTHHTDTPDGKLFTAFLALILVSHIQATLRDLMKEHSWSKHAIIHELDKIRVVTTTDGSRLLSPLTKNQRAILAAFNYTPDDITTYILSHTQTNRICQEPQGI